MFTHPTPVPSSLIPKGCPSSSTDPIGQMVTPMRLQRELSWQGHSHPHKGKFPIAVRLQTCAFLEFHLLPQYRTGRSMKDYARTPCRCYWESGPLFNAGGQNLLKILHTRMIAQKTGTCKAEWGKTGDCTFITKKCWKVNRCPSGQFRLKHKLDDRHSI